ncbi:MAG TPA: cyclic nucleotide-binding domain-containing protein [Spirochaetota bacterium]|nr:cyclic nucleotide-binding domain-containing protein [Spirochaetota bacterium]
MKTVFKAGEGAGCAFFLEKGSITFTIPGSETFELATPNVIFGASEIFLSWHDGSQIVRALAAAASEGAVIKSIQADNLRMQIRHYNVGFNIARQIALELRDCNRVLQKTMESMSARQRRSHEYAKVVADIVDGILTVWKEKRFPSLKVIHDEFAGTLTYKYGVSFRKLASKTVMQLDAAQLGSLLRTYPAGACICRQGDQGEELYILESGELGIYVGENEKPVAIINQTGEVIGEMSLLLQEPRSATMKAESELVLSVIRKDDLKHVAEAQPEFFLDIGTTLARRMHQSVAVIQDLLATKAADARPDCLIEDPHKDTFVALEKRVARERHDHDLPGLKEIHDRLRQARIAIV